MAELSRLELALLDSSGMQLDLYLEDADTQTIIADINAIKLKAAMSTDAGRMRERVLRALDEENSVEAKQ